VSARLTGILGGGLLVLAAAGAVVLLAPATVVAGTPVAGSAPPVAAAPADPPVPAPVAEQPAGIPPGTVQLPRGGEATLVRKEVQADGVLPVPDGVREATWWGAGLGSDHGATVLAGHVNWRGATGPFAELWDARANDAVTVVDTAGTTYRYRISELVTVTKEDLPARAAELFGQDGPARLVLVTCGGRWVGGAEGYSSNRIVIATPA
jgi:sortase family protein